MRAWAVRCELASKAGLKVPKKWIDNAGKYLKRIPGLKILAAGTTLSAISTKAGEGNSGATVIYAIEEIGLGLHQDELNELMNAQDQKFRVWIENLPVQQRFDWIDEEN